MDFLIYALTAPALHLGERAKGNVFKPCLRTIPYTAISGALNRYTTTTAIKAVGFLQERVGCNRIETLTYGPRDRVSTVSKIPLQIEFLADVCATVVVAANAGAAQLPEKFQIALGGMRSHGFGSAQLRFTERQTIADPRFGRLRVRLPEEEAKAFGIRKIERPVYGYLFKPNPGTHTGSYVRSLFEGSIVVGPELLLSLER